MTKYMSKSEHTTGVWWLVLALLACGASLFAQQAVDENVRPTTADGFYSSGNDAHARGDLPDAIEYYRSALEINPSYFEPLVALAELFWLLDEQQQAQEYIDRARRFGRTRIELGVLEARLETSLGRFDAAEVLYREMARREPFNVGALLGRAELAIARGEYKEAEELYQMVIRLEPPNRRALLSQVLLLDLLDRPAEAERVLQTVLRHHVNNPQTQLLAARWFLEQDRPLEARRHAQTVLGLTENGLETAAALDANREAAQLLLTEIALNQSDFAAAVATIDALLQVDPRNHTAWYLRAVALSGMANDEGALFSLQRALQIRPFEEIIRIALEDLLRSRFAPEDAQRASFAQYHFDRGDRYRERNLFLQAQMEYRRGLQIDPFSRAGRVQFADLYLLQGFRSRYLQELEVLEQIGFNDTYLRDRIETYRSLQAESVGAQWDIDQFTISSDRIKVALFVDQSSSRLDYPLALGYAGRYLREVLQFDSHMDVSTPLEVVANRGAAFAAARERDVDYFLLLSFRQRDRNLQVGARLFSDVSGSEIGSYLSLQSGTDRLQSAANDLAAQISSGLPLRGRILARRDDNALIGLGGVHGIGVGDRLLVIRRDRLQVSSSMLGYLYNENDVLGEIEIIRSDDLVSEGRLERRGLFDLFDIGDETLLESSARPLPAPPTEALSPLYRRLLTIR